MKKVLLAAAALAAMTFGGSAQGAVVQYNADDGGHIAPHPYLFSSTIDVPSALSVSDVDITLNFSLYKWWGDLLIYVVHDGVTVWLSGATGGVREAQGAYTFDDEATWSAGQYFHGVGAYSPAGYLSDFDGMSAAGDWTLYIQDINDRNGGGDFHDWTLSLTGAAVPEPATWSMMILGFFGLGSMVRASRRKVAGALT